MFEFFYKNLQKSPKTWFFSIFLLFKYVNFQQMVYNDIDGEL